MAGMPVHLAYRKTVLFHLPPCILLKVLLAEHVSRCFVLSGNTTLDPNPCTKHSIYSIMISNFKVTSDGYWTWHQIMFITCVMYCCESLFICGLIFTWQQGIHTCNRALFTGQNAILTAKSVVTLPWHCTERFFLTFPSVVVFVVFFLCVAISSNIHCYTTWILL